MLAAVSNPAARRIEDLKAMGFEGWDPRMLAAVRNPAAGSTEDLKAVGFGGWDPRAQRC